MHILVVYEQRVIADSIAAVLRSRLGFEIAGHATDMPSALAIIETRKCDVVLVSITLPNNMALELARKLSAEPYWVKVLMTNLVNSKVQVLDCLEEGASGYVYVHESLDHLVMKIQSVCNNEFSMSPDIAAGLISRIDKLKRRIESLAGEKVRKSIIWFNELTEREREVLRMMAIGYNKQQIAKLLVIEVGTVKKSCSQHLAKA